MGQSKRMRSPDAFLEHGWEEKMESRKRRKRESHSSERENKAGRRNVRLQLKTSDGHCLESRSLNQRLDSREQRTGERSLGMGQEADSRGAASLDRERDRDWHHYSKSSGRSGQSRRSRDRGRGRQRSHHTHQSSYSRSRHRRNRSRSVEDDDEGHLIYHNGDMLRARYEIVSTLGEGAFGKVVECLDHSKSGVRVAVKIIKSIDRYRDAAMAEVEILEQMNSLDFDRKYACVRMLDWFDHHGHVCIVFELLGLSTYDFLRENNFQPFHIEQIKHMAYQTIRAVHFLHKSKLTHTDLKPENILFINSEYDLRYNAHMKCDERLLKNPDVKVVDFGNATYEYDYHTSVVSTRHYRAPEVILDLGWDHSCDVWSLGCILIEFYLGNTLFQTHDSKEHLAMMERVLGPLPVHLLQKTRKRRYVHRYKLDWDSRSSAGRYVKKQCRPLKDYMTSQSPDHQQLFDLVLKMLEYDPARRLSLDQALRHPFFSSLRKASTKASTKTSKK